MYYSQISVWYVLNIAFNIYVLTCIIIIINSHTFWWIYQAICILFFPHITQIMCSGEEWFFCNNFHTTMRLEIVNYRYNIILSGIFWNYKKKELVLLLENYILIYIYISGNYHYTISKLEYVIIIVFIIILY